MLITGLHANYCYSNPAPEAHHNQTRAHTVAFGVTPQCHRFSVPCEITMKGDLDEGYTAITKAKINDPSRKKKDIWVTEATASCKVETPCLAVSASWTKNDLECSFEHNDRGLSMFVSPPPPRFGDDRSCLRLYSLHSKQLTCHPRDLDALRDFINLGFSGDFPSGFEKCSLLEQLFLGGNKLTGNVPQDLFQLQRLNLLALPENDLSGSLSPALETSPTFSILMSLRIDSSVRSLMCSTNCTSSSISLLRRLIDSLVESPSRWQIRRLWFNDSLPENLPSCRHLRNVNVARNPILTQALRILQHCQNLTTLILTLNFDNEMLPDDPNLHFKKLQVLAIGNSKLPG
ncbi:unnamed protein product [Arabis nemorensis]|uniref:Uncharacterized protein n=1 Tax=Arabis nemorensis TaxID=586526 RepID=A0A565AQY9_9BRAS|nr:unnamed protein product [Arabis nemorensis]